MEMNERSSDFKGILSCSWIYQRIYLGWWECCVGFNHQNIYPQHQKASLPSSVSVEVRWFDQILWSRCVVAQSEEASAVVWIGESEPELFRKGEAFVHQLGWRLQLIVYAKCAAKLPPRHPTPAEWMEHPTRGLSILPFVIRARLISSRYEIWIFHFSLWNLEACKIWHRYVQISCLKLHWIPTRLLSAVCDRLNPGHWSILREICYVYNPMLRVL